MANEGSSRWQCAGAEYADAATKHNMAETRNWPGYYGYEFHCVIEGFVEEIRTMHFRSWDDYPKIDIKCIGCKRSFAGAQRRHDQVILVRGYVEMNYRLERGLTVSGDIAVHANDSLWESSFRSAALFPCVRFDTLYKELMSTCTLCPPRVESQWVMPSVPYVATKYGTRALIAAGGSYDDLRMAKEYLAVYEAPRSERPYVVWYYGDSPGCVVRTARAFVSRLCPGAQRREEEQDVYENTRGEMDWDGYDGHRITMLHNVHAMQWSAATLAALCGDKPVRVQQAGGRRQFKSKYLVVFASGEPTAEYGDHPDFIELRSRIDEAVHVPPPEASV